MALFASALASFSLMVSGIGIIKDLDEPDRATEDMRVAAKHSGMPGLAPEVDLQEICHLSRLTAEERKLKKPSWAWQEEQKTFRLRVWLVEGSGSGRLWRSVEPCSNEDNEN